MLSKVFHMLQGIVLHESIQRSRKRVIKSMLCYGLKENVTDKKKTLQMLKECKKTSK